MEARPTLHPSAEILRALALGELTGKTAAEVRSHLDSCPTCRAAVASANATLNRPRPAHDSYATQAPAQSLVETARPQQAPLGPTTLFNLPPELVNNSDYEILRELGRGGMGVVYQARHKLSGRMEVLKVMNKALIGQSDSRERFLREIQAAARLDHKNVVKMHTAIERGELMVLVMEYVEGEDLARAVKARGPLSVLNACYYIYQAASGLQHAHEKGMVHRDIKPQNLMLIREGKRHTVKVLDFGLAKATRSESVETGLTGTGAMMGTPGYVAPEQSLDAATADIRADVYSLGCTLYHLLTGAPPFTGKSLFEILQAHHSTDARPLNLVRPEVPGELAAVVRKMMAKDPAARYQTPAQVMQALDPFIKGGPTAPPTVVPAKKNPNLATPEVQALLRQKTVLAETQRVAAGSLSKPLPGSVPSMGSRRNAAVAGVQKPAGGMLSMKWLVGVVAAVVLMLGAIGLWASGVFKVKTDAGGSPPVLVHLQPESPVVPEPPTPAKQPKNPSPPVPVEEPETPEAVLIVEVNEANPEVYVDGEKRTIAWRNDGKRAEIALKPGMRKVEVKKDGFSDWVEEVELQDGRRCVLTPQLVRPATTDKGGDHPPPVGDTADPVEIVYADQFKGRSASAIQEMVENHGGNKDSEAAVARGLLWLALHQAQDGHWSLDEFHKFAREKPRPAGRVIRCSCKADITRPNDAAATGLGLLPFLGAGITHKPETTTQEAYSKTVDGALNWLMAHQARDGSFSHDMYAHGIAAIAMCEAYGLTSDPRLKLSAQRALNFIVFAQDPTGGGWRYAPRQSGDLSVTGWQFMALKSGQMSGLSVPKHTLKLSETFLDASETSNKGGYAYVPADGQNESTTMTSVGLLCRQYNGVNPRNPGLLSGVQRLKASPPDKLDNIYYLYYATQVMHHMQGESWNFWNLGPSGTGKGGIRDTLISRQDTGATPGKEHQAGSWGGSLGGRIMATSLSLLCLEVYYRHLPLYRRDNATKK